MKASVGVDGLDGFRADLKSFGREVGRAPVEEAAAEELAASALGRLRSKGGRMGQVVARRRGIRVRKNKVILAAGSGRDVLAAVFALEYGARRRRYQFSGRHVSQKRTANVGENVPGYYIGWAAKRKSERIYEAVGDEIDRAARRAFRN